MPEQFPQLYLHHKPIIDATCVNVWICILGFEEPTRYLRQIGIEPCNGDAKPGSVILVKSTPIPVEGVRVSFYEYQCLCVKNDQV